MKRNGFSFYFYSLCFPCEQGAMMGVICERECMYEYM